MVRQSVIRITDRKRRCAIFAVSEPKASPDLRPKTTEPIEKTNLFVKPSAEPNLFGLCRGGKRSTNVNLFVKPSAEPNLFGLCRGGKTKNEIQRYDEKNLDDDIPVADIVRRRLRRAGPRERQPAAGEDRESQGLPDAHDHARGAGAHLRSARPRSHGTGGRQTLDGRTGRTPLPATGARRTAGTQGRRHDRRVQHRLRRWTCPHGRPSQSGCRPRLHRHRRGRHHGRRGRNGASGRGRTAPRGGLRGQKTF